MYFASKIKCPILVGVGLWDDVCAPEGVLVAVNQIHSPVELAIYPQGGHQDVKGSHGLYSRRKEDVWTPALVEGSPLPLFGYGCEILPWTE